MRPAEAAEALAQEIESIHRDVIVQTNLRLPRASIVLKNAEIDVLRCNPSPSPPGNVPGTVTGTLMRHWTAFYSMTGANSVFGIKSRTNYSEYLENGTRKMAARPYVDKIQQEAQPDIVRIFSEIGG